MYMCVSNNDDSKLNFGVLVKLFRFNASMEPSNELFLCDLRTVSRRPDVAVAANGTVYVVKSNFNIDSLDSGKYKISEYDTNLALIREYTTTANVHVDQLTDSFIRNR